MLSVGDKTVYVCHLNERCKAADIKVFFCTRLLICNNRQVAATASDHITFSWDIRPCNFDKRNACILHVNFPEDEGSSFHGKGATTFPPLIWRCQSPVS